MMQLPKPLLATLAGIILGLSIGVLVLYGQPPQEVTQNSDEVHVHSDFLFIVNDERIDLSLDAYQSHLRQVLHDDIHFHDGNDKVVHRHAEGITLVEFMASLGFTLTQDCLTTDTGEEYCTGENQVVRYYVNNTPLASIAEYVNQENDKILIYVGRADNPKIAEYQSQISDDSCLYSGTCPERGTPPPSSCGITCELE
jgi:hypothetical protein